ncbi:MAG: CoB--CoM heterodisulfide reductase iron-sulfur subunit A family protein [Deltaproteobacteria bacterium]|nr:CoB--CoM heterodisulfide reductase iron-sulfur subunit A family protein [Deltaproteobacteria bacterium]
MPDAAGKPVGAVMVVGAGVSGIQAALDAANSGFKVYLVDKAASIGGKMSQLDKTFPTNDCSMCILSPKFLECATNPNISILTDSDVDAVRGEAGNFTVDVVQEPRYVDSDKCTGCGLCAEYCPVEITDDYNAGLATIKCIHLPFPQAVPAVSMVDPAQCLFLQRTECQICVPTCNVRAIDFHQQAKKHEIQVGSIILAPGYDVFDPSEQSQYGYDRYRNVITSLEYERLLSASGPNGGVLCRPSDGATPLKIAWIQCVGSRDVAAGNPYCSSVCCMYAMKQVILSKEHIPPLEVVILHNDVRAFGKGFERYYERTKALDGVRFEWAKPSVVGEDPETHAVTLRYRLDGERVKEEAFDLVVLSVGISSPPGNRALAERLGITLNEEGFCGTSALHPMETNRSGIYACGVFCGPMDIPDAVTMAGGAAAMSTERLGRVRGSLVSEKFYPEERDIRGEPPRVGVFVCHCGTNIIKSVAAADVVAYAETLGGVVHAQEDTFSCSIDSIKRMVETIKEKDLNRVVVAACTPRTHEPVFQDALRQAGLNPFLFEMTNIREHCAWVHMGDKKRATRKAGDLVRMATAKAGMLMPLSRKPYTIQRSALVIGGGISGMVCALSLANQGIKVHLVEKDNLLGGMARRLRVTVEEDDVQAYLKRLTERVYHHLLVQVHMGAEIREFSGYVGNFRTTLLTGAQQLSVEIPHGVTVVATGAQEFKPHEYLYGNNHQVLTHLELEEAIYGQRDRIKKCRSLVMIQCVGSRDDERPYCSRVCCGQAVKNALKLKKINPEMKIYVLYRDMRTYGLMENAYGDAADQGVMFIRYHEADKPEVEAKEGDNGLQVWVTEPTLGKKLMLEADLVSLAAATVPNEHNHSLSQALKVPLNPDGFFMEAHMKLRPVDFPTDGIFMCGLAHNPKHISESVAQGYAAASRAMTVLSQEEMWGEGAIAQVNETRCTGCSVCEEVCPFHAVEVSSETGVAVVNSALCKGCGLCAASCRSGALDVMGNNEEQVFSLLLAVGG